MARRAVASALAFGLAAGCGPPVDPLMGVREAYQEALRTDPTTEPPHALVVASDPTVGRILADATIGGPLTAPGPFGMKLVLLPEVTHATTSSDGRDPLHIRAELAGTTDLVFPLLSADDLAWEATVDGALGSWTTESSKGLEVGLRWSEPQEVTVALRLPGAPEQAEALAEGAVRGAIVGALDEGIGFTLPRTPWGAVRDLRLDGTGDGLIGELVLSGLQGAPPPSPAVPDEGVVVSVSEATLLGVAQALAIEQQSMLDKLVVEPMAVDLTPEAATVEVRVHRRSRQPKHRTYRLSAPLTWDGDALQWPVDELELVAEERWRGGMQTRVGEARAVQLLADALAEVPTELTAPVGKRTVELTLTHLELTDGALHLFGAAEVRPADG